jgi:hypothetical protein
MVKCPALGPLPDLPQTVQYVMGGTHNGSTWKNVGYLQYTGIAPDVAALNSVGTAIGNAWNTNIAPMCHANVIMQSVDLLDLTNRGAAIASVTGLAHPGTRAGTDVPNQVAAVISWKINHRYRGGHPRSYWPAGVTADITSGRLWTTGAGSFQTTATAAANAFRTALNAITTGSTTYKMVSWHIFNHDPVTGCPTIDPGRAPYTIQSGLCHGRVDTQRRRLGKETP